MDLDGYRQSSNIEDRSSGGRRKPAALLTVVIAVVAVLLGADPRVVLRALMSSSPPPAASRPAGADEAALKQFVSKVVATTEDAWQAQLPGYQPPVLVIFQDSVQSACGRAGASVGPFYCGEDRKMYIDLSFYAQLRQQLGAPGDFAQGYVIAHEVGHHVQNLLGTLDKVHRRQAQVSEKESKALSVRLELQADYYAGCWAHYVQQKGLLQVGDIEEALQAAAAIGDDRLQQMSQGVVVPDSFTHGSSQQRVNWFRQGLESGDYRRGDTFSVSRL